MCKYSIVATIYSTIRILGDLHNILPLFYQCTGANLVQVFRDRPKRGGGERETCSHKQKYYIKSFRGGTQGVPEHTQLKSVIIVSRRYSIKIKFERYVSLFSEKNSIRFLALDSSVLLFSRRAYMYIYRIHTIFYGINEMLTWPSPFLIRFEY